MAWQDELPTILRHMIGDITPPYTYDDSRLEDILVVSAQLIKKEVTFVNTYTIDVTEVTISPDPTDSQTKDDFFISLVCLKAAVLIAFGELKQASTNSIRITDGGATIDTSATYQAKKSLYDTLLKDYDKAKISYQVGNLSAVKAILSPYTQSGLGGGYDFG